MSVLSVAQSVCKVIGLEVPEGIVASTQREHVELAGVMQEMAQRIADAYDWQLFNRLETMTGDGTTEDFDLPSDYGRMTFETQVWSSSLLTPLDRITSRDKWLELDIRTYEFIINAWIIYGGQMHVKPALASAVTAKYWYQSNLLFAPASGSNKAEFTADDDTYRLNERLWKMATIYQWRNNKGQPYAEDMADYEELKERLVMQDKGARMLVLGTQRIPGDAKIAYPQSITG